MSEEKLLWGRARRRDLGRAAKQEANSLWCFMVEGLDQSLNDARQKYGFCPLVPQGLRGILNANSG